MLNPDITILRELTEKYAAVCHQKSQQDKRTLWRAHNSLKPTPIPLYIRAFAWSEMEASKLSCQDPFLRHYEDELRRKLFWADFEDDSTFEPWLVVDAPKSQPENGIWGVPQEMVASMDPRGAKIYKPPVISEEDIHKLVATVHKVDEKAARLNQEKLADAVGDILPVVISRAPVYWSWNADISTSLGYILGLEGMMWHMMDRPEWLHEILSFMRDGILKAQADAEAAGHWTLLDHSNQAMPYALELADPGMDGQSVNRSQLWCFTASQETTQVGPDMFNEFMLQYQLPIMKKFGLVAYGCCEDLTRKIDLLRQIPNLRRIAISPMANVAACAEQIQNDYVMSYRPSPSDMVGYDFDPVRIRRILREDLAACRNCCVDITLKDVETVGHDPQRIKKWVQIVREVTDEFGITGK